jgi:branched-chain amino acid transport system substrate-binding protein
MKSSLKLVLLGLLVISGLTVIAKEDLKPYVVGAFCSVTGSNAPLGQPERDTLIMLAEQINDKGGINGHPLKLLIEDDGSDNTNAVMAAKKLIDQDNVCAIIGSSGTAPTMAVIPVTEEAGVPHISMAAGATITIPLKKWVFRTPQTDTMALERILSYLVGNKIDKVAMIYDSNSFGTNGRDQLRIIAPNYKVSIVDEEAFATKDTDMTVQLTKIKSAKVQAIICWGTNPGPAQVAKNAKQLGITLPLLMSHGIASQAFLDVAGDAANGVVLPAGKLIVANQLPDSDPQKALLLKYISDFQTKFNYSTNTFGGHAWDAFNIIVNALKNAGDDRVKLRNEIEKTKKLAGTGGVFNYSPTDHDGLTKDAFIMVKIVDGKWTLLKK